MQRSFVMETQYDALNMDDVDIVRSTQFVEDPVAGVSAANVVVLGNATEIHADAVEMF